MNIEQLEARKLEIAKKIQIFVGSGRHADIVAKLEKELEMIEHEIELSKKVTDTIDSAPVEEENQIKDSTLNGLYADVLERLETLNNLRSMNLPYENSLHMLKKKVKDMLAREELARTVYEDLELKRPHEITLFMKAQSISAEAINEKALNRKKENTKLNKEEEDSVLTASIDTAINLLNPLAE